MPSEGGAVEQSIQSPERSNTLPWQIDVQARVLDWVLDSIRAADSKSSVLLAIDAALLGSTIAAVASSGGPPPFEWATALLGIAFFGLGLFAIGIALLPRTEGPGGSLLYFGEVASRPLAEYVQLMRTMTQDNYLTDLALQCHRNSEIASAKFRWLSVASWLILLGVIPWSATLALLPRY